MGIPLCSERRKREVAEKSDSGVESLVRRLVKQVKHQEQTSTGAEQLEDQQKLMLDLHVDGVRCVLVRSKRSKLTLSPREREIARMVAKGYPNKTIAAVLEISTWTVATYLRRVFAKLAVGSRTAMVTRLMEEGFELETAASPPRRSTGTSRDGR